MIRKPLVVYVEEKTQTFGGSNNGQVALLCFLEKYSGYDVITCDNEHSFNVHFSTIKKHIEDGLLILAIVKQEECSDQDRHIIAKIRKFSKTLPIIVICDNCGRKNPEENSDDLIAYVNYYSENRLAEIVEEEFTKWQEKSNFFDVKTNTDLGIITSQLEKAYEENHPDDLGMTGSPDPNHKTVAEALRLRLFSSSCLIKEEFDGKNEETSQIKPTESPIYWAEIEKIADMTDEKREVFKNLLAKARGLDPIDKNKLLVVKSNPGFKVQGFAIDPDTFETETTQRFGEQHFAEIKLADRIEIIEDLRKNRRHHKSEDEELECKNNECVKPKNRIVSGLIFLEIEGFTTPILCLNSENKDKKTMEKIASFLMNEQKYIPVNFNGELFI